jgi:hypothetical protein
MANRKDVVNKAREYIGTKFHHQGRLKGVGIDCAGLVIGVAKDLNLTNFDFINYGHLPHADTLERLCDENLEKVSLADMQEGDILLMAFESEPQHLAIKTDIGIIHSYAQVRRCVEHSLDNVWLSRIKKCYRYRGLEDG